MPEKDPLRPAHGGAPGAAGPDGGELGADGLALLGAQPPRRTDPRDIGPYRVLARLGGGGMGRLYLGRDAAAEGGYESRSLVAVKVIRSEYAEDDRFRRRFEREIEAVRRVHGAYTAELLGSGFDHDEHLWMATAYVPGLNLADAVLRCGSLPAPVVWRLAHEIGQALAAIAAAGIVHRDLKPSNVLLGAQGARVIDFGVAHTADASSLTMTGQHLGTPSFMSPEQADGREVGPASDVFSLGSVLAMAVTGAAPFGEGTTGEVIHRVIHAAPSEQVLGEVAGRDPALAELIGRCLDKDPQRRPSAQDVVTAAREHPVGEGWPADVAATIEARTGWRGTAVDTPAADQLTILRRTKPEPAQEGEGARAGRRRPLLIAAGAAVVAAATAGVLAFTGSGDGGSGATAQGAPPSRTPSPQPTASRPASPPAAGPSAKPQTRRTKESPVTVVTVVPPPAGSGSGGGSDGGSDGGGEAGRTAPPSATAPARPAPTAPRPTTAPATAAAKPWKSCTYYSGNALTVSGQSGSRVKEVQCVLRARRYDLGPSGVDGVFGPDTLTAVKRFQSNHHLYVDGQVGEDTWHALRA